MAASRRDPNRRLLEVAYHEAGHAVAALFFGFVFIDVKVGSRSRVRGWRVDPVVLSIGDTLEDIREAARQEIVVLYAGLAAQRLLNPRAPVDDGGKDREDARGYAAEYGHVRRLPALRREAGELVERCRAQIAHLAEALVASRRLTYAEAESVVGRLPPHE